MRQIESDQISNTAQVAFKLRSKVISHDWYQSLDPNQIVITLRTPLGQIDNHIESVKDKWRLDMVVLDPGHGDWSGLKRRPMWSMEEHAEMYAKAIA